MSTTPVFKSKEAEDYVVVSEIAKRFEAPHTDLTAVEGRAFVMEGTLVRQASSRWKTVTRECFLFSDIFVFAVKIDKKQNSKLEMKQVIDLSTAVLDDRTKGKTALKHCVCITTPDREYVVSAKTAEEREGWVKNIAMCIGTLKGVTNERGTLVTQHSIHLGTIFSSVVLNNLVDMKKNMKQRGFDINAKDASGNSALHLAIENGHMEALELLLECVKDDPSFLMSATNESGYPALHLACVEGNVGVVKRLLEAKADVKQLDESKCSCAFVAVTSGVCNVAKTMAALVAAGADFRARGEGGKTLMHLAAEMNDGDTVTALTIAGLELTAECNHGRAPLHYAAQTNSPSACEALLGEGAGPNGRDQNLNTPLHLARSVQIGVMLVAHGGRMELKNVHDLPASAFFDSDQKGLAVVHMARDTWTAAKSAERDEEVCTDKEQWVNDKLSDVCQLCYDTFTITRRRHHCRRCGSLVCGACSSKKFKIMTTPNEKPEKERCCDSCYNVLRYKIVKRKLVEQKIREAAEAAASADKGERLAERQAKRDEETKERRARIKAEEGKTKAVAKRIKDSNASAAKRNKDAAGKTAAVMGQNKQMLANNIERLQQTEENAAKMEDEAESFAKNCTALKGKFS